MADEEKHVVDAPQVAPVDEYASAQNEFVDRPNGWIYKGYKVFGREIYYASPRVQLLLVALVCFLCPGMYNSLSGLGGGGQVDPKAQDHSSVALYSTFAVVGFFSGTFANRLGLRLTIGIGGLGYCIYSASFLSYNHNKNIGFVIFAGAFLGVCAGLLWTAQGAVMMAYPPENKKGRYISTFWIIFNLGAVIGSLVRLSPPIFFLQWASMLFHQRLMLTFFPDYNRSPLLRTFRTTPELSAMAPMLPSSFSCSSV